MTTSDALPVDLEAHLGYWLRLVSNQVSGAFARALLRHDVSVAEWVALARIEARPATRPIDLSEELGMTRGAITKVMGKLEAKGRVAQSPAPRDSRSRLLTATSAGRDGLPRLNALADANDQQCFAGLDAAEQALLRRLPVKLARHDRLRAVPIDESTRPTRSTMSNAIENLQAAMNLAVTTRPAVGGFPHLAETLRQAGVIRNVWTLPACQSLYLTTAGPVVMSGDPLVTGVADVPAFDQAALITALRNDQAGHSTFPEFLAAAWRAGVVRYEVDFQDRTVSYYGADGDPYVEAYPAV